MAGKQSIVAQIAAKPLGQQVGILVGIIVVLGGLYYQFFYSSLQEDLKTAKGQYTRLEKDHKKLKTREKEWTKMVKEKEALDDTLATNQLSLPRAAALPSFIGHLQRQAAVAGVTFKNWSRKKEEPTVAYVKVPVSIDVIGSFHQVLKYFFLLGKTERIITIENFSLKEEKADSDDVLLQASFVAATFRQTDEAVAAIEAEKTKTGMINKAKDARAKKEAQVEAVTGGKTDESGNPVNATGVERLKQPKASSGTGGQ